MPSRCASHLKRLAIHTVAQQHFEVVDVNFVVVNHATFLVVGGEAGIVNAPVELNRHSRLGFLLDFGEHAFFHDSSRSDSAAVVGNHELTNKHLIAVVATLHAQTDVLDVVALRNAAEVDSLGLPSSAGEVAKSIFLPSVAAFGANNHIEVGCVGAFQTILQSHCSLNATSRSIELGAIEHDVGAGSRSRSRATQANR